MAVDFSELTVQVTLTIGELREVVSVLNLGSEFLQRNELEPPVVIEDVTRMYFELMQNLEEDGYFGEFAPEQ